MKWLKRNRLRVLLILIHALILARLLLDAYQVNLADPFAIVFPVLRIALPAALIGTALVGLIRDRRPAYLLLGLAGALFLWRSFVFDPEGIVEAIGLINDKLSSGRSLRYRDFAFLLDYVTLLTVALSFITIYVHPWNLLVVDLSFLFFLWAVDSLPRVRETLTPMVLFWAFLLVYDRMAGHDGEFAHYGHARVDQRGRLLQATAIAALIGLVTVNGAGEVKGRYYERVWMQANDYLMQDDFLPGNYFLDAFSLSYTGYSDSSTTLGGDVTLNNNIALRVTGALRPEYLRGNTKRVYTGRIWEKSDLLYRTDNTASELITDRYGDAAQSSVTITPAGVETSSLFVPIYPRSVTLSERTRDNRIYYSIQDQTFMVSEAQTEPYTVWYHDQSQVEGLAMAGASDAVSREELPYLELPETVTERTRELVEEITAGITEPTEKMLAITEYLRANYAYTLEPGDAPANQDFVDHFLFEVREGYCVYYASALTVMLRIAGIPARYVEGFKVPTLADGEGTVLVRNSDAHAWTEVLTDPEAGLWTIWDATGTPREQGAVNGGTGSNPDPVTTPGSATTPPRTLAEDTLPDPSTIPGGGPVPIGGNLPALPDWLWTLLASLALAGGAVGLRTYRRRQLLEKRSDGAFLQRIVALLTESGMTIEESQTLTDIGSHIVDADLQRQFNRFVQAHYRAAYGSTLAQTPPAQRQRLLRETLRVHRQSVPWLRHRLRRWFY